MLKRIQPVIAPVGYIVFWLGLAVFATLTAFQIYGTLIAISLAVTENPSLRPLGWSIDPIHALRRVFCLVLGILWLGWVMFTEGYLREGYQRQQLKHRTLRLIIILGATYMIFFVIPFLLR